MRSFVIVACVLVVFGAGCDKLRKKPEPAAGSGSGSGSAGPPPSGHSVTKLKQDAGTALGSGVSGPDNHVGSGSGSGTGSAALLGGDGSPAHRNDDGRVHGPGGPVFMGRGASPCDAAHDHCMRDGVWFSVANIMPGKLFRAQPVFEFEKKWFTWRGEPAETPGQLYKTQIAGNAKIAAGTHVIWFSSETSEAKFTDSEYEALTSSRWEAGVVESMSSPTVVMIQGFGSTPLDTVRLITETRAP